MRIAGVIPGSASTPRAGGSHDWTFFRTPISTLLPRDSRSTVATSTLWSSAMRAPMYPLIRGSRTSVALSVTESKYSSTRPFVKVP